MKNIFLFTGLLMLGNTLFAQKYNYKFKINGLKDTIAILGNYYGNQQFAKDTFVLNSSGEFEMTGELKDLEHGLYFIYLPDKSYFEFLVYNEDKFEIEADYKNLLNSMKVTGSPQNKEFLEFQKYMIAIQKEGNTLKKQIDSLAKTDQKTEKEKLELRVKELSNKMNAYNEKLYPKRDKYLIAQMAYIQKDVDLPAEMALPKNRADSLMQYAWYKNHFYDHLNFNDYAIANTPILVQRNDMYFDKILTQDPDTLASEAIKLCERAKDNRILFKTLVSTLTDKFNQSKMMGMDKAFVTMVDYFFETNRVDWLSKDRLFRIKHRASELRPCLIGKPAYPLILRDDKNVLRELYSIKSKYTVVMFWDPDCGHCKKEMPHVLSFYNSYKPKGVEIYAVTTENEVDKWKKFIYENGIQFINVFDPNNESNFRNYYDIFSTPQFFILDSNKKIIAKRLGAEQLGGFIDSYEKLNQH
jgi:thiol-disulfide isomerase/thioredoxin